MLLVDNKRGIWVLTSSIDAMWKRMVNIIIFLIKIKKKKILMIKSHM